MNTEPLNSSVTPVRVSDTQPTAPDGPVVNNSNIEPSRPSPSGISSWAKKFQIPQSVSGGPDESNSPKSALARLTSGIGLRLSPRDQTTQQNSDGSSSQSNFIGNLTKGIVDSSKSAVKAVTVRARHAVSQNKRRYQEDGFDLDLTYITENIIAMGFPAGDMSSGFLGYVEGIYRNHMEEVIRFLETHHKGKYKVYNLCSERLYDVSLFEGKVASFPFDDHNCPPIQLITSFCRSAYSWLKDDIENVVAVHCKAGMARTGLMISSLILYLKFFPTAEESIDFYNQKRCFDGKALVLPSQIRYVKYFERVLTYFNGNNQPGRLCMLRGFRLHRCPYWIRPHITISNHNGVLFSTKKHPRTKDLSPEEFWFSPPKKGITVFALPGERGITQLAGDFRVYFHDRQGDFYFWLNTTMTENRKTLSVSDIDWFEKRKLPSPGFQVEVVLVDYDGSSPPSSPATQPSLESPSPQQTSETHNANPSVTEKESSPSISNEGSKNQDKNDVFSDSEGEEDAVGSVKGRKAEVSASTRDSRAANEPVSKNTSSGQMESLTRNPVQISNGKESLSTTSSATESTDNVASGGGSEFKVVAADASVFTFGDEEDFESD